MSGPLIASFDHGDARMSPGGLTVYGDDEAYEIKLGVEGEDGRDGRINTFYDAIVHGRPLPADGAWGMATLEVLLAIEESGRTRTGSVSSASGADDRLVNDCDTRN